MAAATREFQRDFFQEGTECNIVPAPLIPDQYHEREDTGQNHSWGISMDHFSHPAPLFLRTTYRFLKINLQGTETDTSHLPPYFLPP